MARRDDCSVDNHLLLHEFQKAKPTITSSTWSAGNFSGTVLRFLYSFISPHSLSSPAQCCWWPSNSQAQPLSSLSCRLMYLTASVTDDRCPHLPWFPSLLPGSASPRSTSDPHLTAFCPFPIPSQASPLHPCSLAAESRIPSPDLPGTSDPWLSFSLDWTYPNLTPASTIQPAVLQTYPPSQLSELQGNLGSRHTHAHTPVHPTRGFSFSGSQPLSPPPSLPLSSSSQQPGLLLPFLLSPPSVAARPLTVPSEALRVLLCLSHPVTCLLQLQRCPRCSWNLPRACGLETSALPIPSASVSPQLLGFLPHLFQVGSNLILLKAPPCTVCKTAVCPRLPTPASILPPWPGFISLHGADHH